MSCKILLIGESCRDIFVYCDCTRLCPEAPVPVLNVIDQHENGGMAKNVFNNLQSLGANIDIVTNDNWFNITKTRYVHQNSNQMFFRVDTPHNIDRIDQKILHGLDFSRYDAVVVSDYNKGFLHEEDIEFIGSNTVLSFLDTKKILDKWANTTFIKINDYEYRNSETFLNSCKSISDRVIHTQGENGCFYQDKRFPVKKKVEVKDVSGAGDTFLAALVVQYLKTENIEKALVYANKCASKIVTKRGVSVI